MSLTDYIQVIDLDLDLNFLEQIIESCEPFMKPIQFPNDPKSTVIKNVYATPVIKDSTNSKIVDIDKQIFKHISDIVKKYHEKVPFMKFIKDIGYHIIKIEKGGYHSVHIDNDKGITIIIKLHMSNSGKLMLLDGKYDPRLNKFQACVFPSNFVFPWSFEEVTGEPAYYIYTMLNQ